MGGRHGHHDTPHHHSSAASSWWRLVRARTLVLVPPPAIRQQSRLLPERHDATGPVLHRFVKRSPRNHLLERLTPQRMSPRRPRVRLNMEGRMVAP